MATDKASQVFRSFAVVFLLLVVVAVFEFPSAAQPVASSGTGLPQPPAGQLWHFQCVDTMKYSRDAAREFLGDLTHAQQFVSKEVAEIQSLGATCVSVATPYDDEFLPFLKIWANTTHAAGLKVWFRGNFSGWEGWFSYPPLKSPDEHHTKLTAFILGNADLFSEGDILSPAPEAENGMLGNPWATSSAAQQLRDFVWKSADTCQKAITAIGKKVNCGYFSANGDVARDVYNHDLLKKAGGVTAIDHYISSASKYGQDLDLYAQKHGLPIVVGEFGAPIGDINGNMTENQQAQFIADMLRQMYTHKNQILGINYWVLRGGSTALLNPDGTERKVAEVVRDYMKPGVVRGRVVDGLGRAVKNLTVTTGDGVQQVQTDGGGNFVFSFPPGAIDVLTANGTYVATTTRVGAGRGGVAVVTITVQPTKPSWWYRMRLKAKL